MGCKDNKDGSTNYYALMIFNLCVFYTENGGESTFCGLDLLLKFQIKTSFTRLYKLQ